MHTQDIHTHINIPNILFTLYTLVLHIRRTHLAYQSTQPQTQPHVNIIVHHTATNSTSILGEQVHCDFDAPVVEYYHTKRTLLAISCVPDGKSYHGQHLSMQYPNHESTKTIHDKTVLC